MIIEFYIKNNAVFLVMILEFKTDKSQLFHLQRIGYLINLSYSTYSALDMRSLLSRVDILFYRNGIPIFRASKGNVNSFEKSEFDKSKVKLQCLTAERETTFGFELSGGSKN